VTFLLSITTALFSKKLKLNRLQKKELLKLLVSTTLNSIGLYGTSYLKTGLLSSILLGISIIITTISSFDLFQWPIHLYLYEETPFLISLIPTSLGWMLFFVSYAFDYHTKLGMYVGRF